MVLRQKHTPEHALERPSPCWNLLPSSCDPDTGGEGGSPPTTPMSKLFSRLLGLAPHPSLVYLSCAMAPTRSTPQRRLEDLTCVHPNAAGLDIGGNED